MSLYENQKCPVCGVAFKSGDDIVTCPECGTPHHRQCYEKVGKCANAELHRSGFVYNRHQNENTQKQPQEAQSAAQQGNPYFIPPNAEQTEHSADSAQKQTGAYTHIPMQNGKEPASKTAFVFKNDEKIDGVLLSDIITVIGGNFIKFITKFKKNKKLSWNWSAFIFGPYYLFFRKMYGPGTLFLALEFAARFIISMVFSKQLTAFSNGAMALMQDTSVSPAEYYSGLSSLMQSSGVSTAYLILIAVLLVIHLLIAVIADRLYRHKVFFLIADVDKKLDSGATIAPSPFAMQNEAEMSQAEIRKLFLAGRGGVSFFAPCIAFLVLSFVTDIIAYL